MPKATVIKDRAAITDHISDVMHGYYRDTSIDVLLTRPFACVRMAFLVAVKSGRIKQRRASAILGQLQNIIVDDIDALEIVNEILRAAIAARKRGDLKKDKV